MMIIIIGFTFRNKMIIIIIGFTFRNKMMIIIIGFTFRNKMMIIIIGFTFSVMRRKGFKRTTSSCTSAPGNGRHTPSSSSSMGIVYSYGLQHRETIHDMHNTTND